MLVRVFREAGGIGLAVGPQAGRAEGNLARFHQLPADLGHQLPPHAELLGQVAVGPLVMEPEPDLDGPSPLGAGQGEAVEEVGAGHEVERLGERPGSHLGQDRPLAERDGRGVAVEAVGDQEPPLDVEDGDRRHPAPGVHVAMDGVVVEPVSEVQRGVQDQVIERQIVDFHRRPP